jgi:hypothetical protein
LLNSNITWVEDNVHSGFDVLYTMDDLDRLIDAEEGTRSGSSITTRKRHQTWLHSGSSQLSHTGNWARSKLDTCGATWTSTGMSTAPIRARRRVCFRDQLSRGSRSLPKQLGTATGTKAVFTKALSA